MAKAQKILGLDIGIASLGWSVIDNANSQIVGSGVRCFTKAEEPKTGESLAAPRRTKRLVRRLIRRKAQRLGKIRQLFVGHGVITEGELDNLYITGDEVLSPWELRYEALQRKLSGKEFARVLTHIAKRRGFRSNSKAETEKLRANKTEGKLLSGIETNESLLEMGDNGVVYRTAGEMLFRHPRFSDNKRNKAGSYINSISRDMLEREVDIIFEEQRKFGNQQASDSLKNEFKHYAFRQIPIRSVDKMVGFCEFEQNEKRAAKHSYSSEVFVLLTKINNLRIVDKFGKERGLDEEERELVFNEAHKKKDIKFSQLRNWLALGNDEKFKAPGLVYSYKKDKDPEKGKYIELKGYQTLKKAVTDKLGDIEWHSLEQQHRKLDIITSQLTLQKNDDDIKSKLAEAGIKQEIIDAVLGISFDKFTRLSLKAIGNIIPYMRNGARYDEACEIA